MTKVVANTNEDLAIPYSIKIKYYLYMKLQYLSDNFGNKTAVVIPISDWEKITKKHKDLVEELEVPTIPEWHKDIIDKRLKDYKENPNNVTEFDSFCDELEKELL
ncbi:Conserved hypothetical protein CHP02574, addiction module [Flavobacteriaceae bacterium]